MQETGETLRHRKLHKPEIVITPATTVSTTVFNDSKDSKDSKDFNESVILNHSKVNDLSTNINVIKDQQSDLMNQGRYIYITFITKLESTIQLILILILFFF